MSQITQRDAFWNQIFIEAKKNKDIIVITADMGAPALDQFRLQIPSQFVNVGIAEQNGILIASGLALKGKIVFVYAIAPFITARCIEQTRVCSGIMKIPFTIVGVSGGFGYPDSGPTHHATEDIAMMRSIPFITVQSTSDAVMAKEMARRSFVMKHTNYVRLDRAATVDLYNENSDFSEGLCILKEGKSYIISTGCMTHVALEAAEALNKKGLEVGVIDLFEFPIQEQPFLKAIKNADSLITLEEHFAPGGLGGAVCEVLMDHQVFKPIERMALPQDKGYCYAYGGREVIQKYYGVDLENVIKRAEQFIPKNQLSKADVAKV
jgi:transketolase